MSQLSIQRQDAPGDDLLINFGPQHPSTHGVINLVVETDGEVITRAIPDVGYLHRSLEKIGEKCTYHGYMPYTDRIDYVAAMFANEGYARVIERLQGIEVPQQAEYCRVLACELCRIASHMIAVGTNATDIGAVTPLLHATREREYANDLLEELCGARLTYNYMRIGGVSAPVPIGWLDKLSRFLDHLEPIMIEFNRLITENEIYVQRLANIAPISAKEAIAFGLVGPNLRASGVDWDLRRDVPYGVYPDFDFEVPVGRGERGTVGDCYDRWLMRVREILQSARILRQAIEKYPTEGEFVAAKVPRKLKPKANEAQSRIESARGEMAYYVVADGGENPYRVRARTGSFAVMTIVEKISRGLMIQDLIAFFASIDVVAPEIDR
ncbi:MAG: NADH-quinone oxidoreductase subunit D [Deltaproteobacteria bacterium]|nr:NADH-quinone oxidoreductase subunit D [Deltaproteobacteria bacterium]